MRPSAETLMVDDPKSMPFRVGNASGVVAPCGKKTFGRPTATFDGSLLDNATVMPPWGAGCVSVTVIATDWPGCTVRF